MSRLLEIFAIPRGSKVNSASVITQPIQLRLGWSNIVCIQVDEGYIQYQASHKTKVDVYAN